MFTFLFWAALQGVGERGEDGRSSRICILYFSPLRAEHLSWGGHSPKEHVAPSCSRLLGCSVGWWQPQPVPTLSVSVGLNVMPLHLLMAVFNCRGCEMVSDKDQGTFGMWWPWLAPCICSQAISHARTTSWRGWASAGTFAISEVLASPLLQALLLRKIRISEELSVFFQWHFITCWRF